MNELEHLLANHLIIMKEDETILFDTLMYIENEGLGSKSLENIINKTFGQTNEEYIKKIKKKISENSNCYIHLANALFTWYDSWHINFNVNPSNIKTYNENQPYHTWLYCLLNGLYREYQALHDKELLLVDKTEYNKLVKNKNKFSNIQSYEEEYLDNSSKNVVKEVLYSILEKDLCFKMKYLLYDKTLAVFHESTWNINDIEYLKKTYHLKDIIQKSALTPPNGNGDYDFIIFITSRASHSTQFSLEKTYSRDKIYLIAETNRDKIMSNFLNQLSGKESVLNAYKK